MVIWAKNENIGQKGNHWIKKWKYCLEKLKY